MLCCKFHFYKYRTLFHSNPYTINHLQTEAVNFYNEDWIKDKNCYLQQQPNNKNDYFYIKLKLIIINIIKTVLDKKRYFFFPLRSLKTWWHRNFIKSISIYFSVIPYLIIKKFLEFLLMKRIKKKKIEFLD